MRHMRTMAWGALALTLTMTISMAGTLPPATTVPATCWSKTYGAALEDSFLALKPAANNTALLVAGGVDGDPLKPLSAGDALVARLDANGVPVWARSYGGSQNDWAGAIWPIEADGVLQGAIVAGNTRSFPWEIGGGDVRYGAFFLLRVDALGNPLWMRVYRFGMDLGNVQSVQTTTGADGRPDGFIVGGHANGQQADGYIVRTDLDGDVAWARKVVNEGGAGVYDEVWRVAQTKSPPGFIATGWSQANVNPLNENDRSAWILKLAPDGAEEWFHVYGSATHDEKLFWVKEIQAHGKTRYVAAGVTRDPTDRTSDGWVLMVEANGTAVWQRWLGEPGSNEQLLHVHHIHRNDTDHHDLLVSGDTTYGATGTNGLLARLDHHGEVQWSRYVGGARNEKLPLVEPVGVAADGHEYYVAAGHTDSFGQGMHDGWGVRFRGAVSLTPDPLSGLVVGDAKLAVRNATLPSSWPASETGTSVQTLVPLDVKYVNGTVGFVSTPLALGAGSQAASC